MNAVSILNSAVLFIVLIACLGLAVSWLVVRAVDSAEEEFLRDMEEEADARQSYKREQRENGSNVVSSR